MKDNKVIIFSTSLLSENVHIWDIIKSRERRGLALS